MRDDASSAGVPGLGPGSAISSGARPKSHGGAWPEARHHPLRSPLAWLAGRDAIADPDAARRLLLPRPGPVWGPYPMRPADDPHPQRPAFDAWRPAMPRLRRLAAASRRHEAAWARLADDAPARTEALSALRVRLRKEGLRGDALAHALAAACDAARRTLDLDARDTQRLAALALLESRFVEMATGEGKTLAVALAAAVAALAGVPVHVVTANPYLAARDASRARPLAARLGLTVAALPEDPHDDAGRRAAYRHDIVHATARDLAFDFLRDRHDGVREPSALAQAARALTSTSAPAPRLRGLCLALVDEADSVLLDEAEVPLILSRETPGAPRRAAVWQAMALARGLRETVHFLRHEAERTVTLTPAGEDALAAAAGPDGAALDGPWRRARWRREVVEVALGALHAYRRDVDYVLREGRVEILDAVTGRVAEGRVWSRGLHAAVAMKEGLAPPADTETVAQVTFQRFFQRYWRLGGLSGTLAEAAPELRAVHGAPVVRVGLHVPSRRVDWPARRFDDDAARREAVLRRVRELHAAGRPVLVGTDGVAASRALSAVLSEAGIAHQVLDALQDVDEAALVAEAGRAGRVTVATRMAGRGTDIVLDEAARASGGLHVIVCQDNRSRRLDRQLEGRAGRSGDPGSTETWAIRDLSADRPAPSLDRLGGWDRTVSMRAADRLAEALRRWRQRREERRRAAARQALLRQDLQWERRLSFSRE